jgi:Ca2+-binding RTX toxin-like protein/Mg-chelatase subunit ChlD
VVTFTEGDATAGSKVADFTTFDEDGDAITVSVEPSAYYEVSGDSVVLTAAGAELVNGGNDLPEFTVSATDGIQETPATDSATPGATVDVNDAATIEIVDSSVVTFTEGDATAGSKVADFTTFDEDGDAITVSVEPSAYYEVSGDSVVLTAAGAELVNGGNDLPEFTVSATDGIQETPATDSATPGATVDVNDAVELTVTQTLDIIVEGDAAEDMVIATTSTYDEDGDVVTITVSDTVNYKVDENGQILLTQAGADLVNSGADLPDYQVLATDGIQDTPTVVNVNPVDTTDKPDVPEINNITDTNGDMSEVLVHGTGEAGNTVTLYDRDNNVIGTTIVESDGSWSINVAGLSNDVDHFIKATQTNASNIESDATQEVHTVQSDTNVVTDSSDDYIFTGEGNDFVQYNGDDNNNDLVIDGGDGSDTVTFTNETDDLTINLKDNQNETIGDDSVELRNIENIYGGQGDDTITGDDQNNILYGDGGNDTIKGGKGDDGVYGGDGDDILHGGQGNDILGGGKGNDTLIGGEGDDRLHGQGGDDIVIGGAGNDTIRTDGGTDTVVFSGNLADYTFNHNSSNSHIIAIDNRPDSPDGTDDVYGAEFFQFADITVSTAIVHSPSIDVISSSDTGDSNTDNITNDSTPTVQIPLAAGVTAGYVVSVYGENGKLVDYTVTAQDAQNGYVQIETPEFTQDGEYSLTATVTNMLGAEGREGVSVDITIDTNADAATVTFESAGDDNVYNQEELGTDGTVTVNIALPDDVQAGDMVTINGQNTILTDQIIASGSIDIEALPSTEVTVTITDIAGNVSDPVIITTPDADIEALTTNDTATTGEDNSVTIDVLANDESGSTITDVQAPTNSQGEPLGTVEIVMVDGKQQLKFTPSDDFDALNEGQSENVEFTYTTTDAAGNSGQANVNVTVEGQNNDLTYQSESAAFKNVIGYYELDSNGAPISPATVVIDDQNGMESGTHLADLDPNKEYGFFIISNGADAVNENSVITVDATGNILIDGNTTNKGVYHDNPEFNSDGKDHFVMESDGNGGTTIRVEDLHGLGDADFNDVVMHLNYELTDIIANDVQANNDSATTNEESAVLIDVLSNDKDATGDELSITQIQGQDVSAGQTIDVVVNNEVVGTAKVVNGQIEFTPGDKFDSLNDGQSDQVTFSYTTSDGKAGEDTANVTVTVNGETDNHGPDAVDDVPTVENINIVKSGNDIDNLGDQGSNDRYGSNMPADVETQTFDFGSEYAGKTVTLTFDSHVTGGWEDGRNGETLDTFKIYSNDTLLDTRTYDETYDHDNTWDNSHSYQVTLDENGRAQIAFEVASTHEEELVDISNIELTLSDQETTLTTDEDSALVIDVLANDTDADGDALSITSVQNPVMLNGVAVGTAEIVTVDGKQQVKFTPNEALDSLDEGEIQDVSFTYSISDGNGGSDTATTTVRVTGNNNLPSSVDEVTQVDLDSQVTQTTSVDVSGGDGHQVTNIVLTIDVSGSMTNGRHGGVVQLPDGSYTTRLQLAKESLENIINEFDGVGDVNVNLTTFNSQGSSYGWMSAQDAINTINRLQAGGGTNYEDAVHDTVTHFTNVPAADKTIALFVSDGEPTVGNDGYHDNNLLDNHYINEWKGFVEDNVDQLVIVGMGTGIKDTSYLETLAVEVGDVQVDMLVIENEVELNEVLIETIIHANNEVEGNLLDNVEGGDGAITLDGITIDGVTYTQSNFPADGVTTPEGGVLKVNFQTGEYSYKASTANFDADVTESFTVSASDKDGDVTTFGLNVTVNVDDSASAPTLTMDIGEATVVTTEGSVVNPDLSNATDYGNGNNGYNTVNTSDSDDTVIIGNKYDSISLNDGNDNAQIGDASSSEWGELYTGNGNDTVVAGDNWNEVNLGNGNDELSIGDTGTQTWDSIKSGNGNDTVIAGDNWDEIKLGDGNDTLNAGNIDNRNTWSEINAGNGNDNITVGHGYSVINGGRGNDTVTFKGDANEYSVGRNSSGYTTVTYNATGQTTILKNVENYKFGGEDANTGQATTSYVYPISLNAGLTDTDGSESLSDITLSNIPSGATLKDNDDNEIAANADGTYTVPTDENGDVDVTLVSQHEIAQDDIKDIKASVTSTESKGEDESTINVTEDAFVIEDVADLKLDSDQPQQINGSDDYDTMIFEDDISLNFEKLAQNVKEMEAIDLRNEQADTLNEISSSDVLKITDEDNVLKILGEDGDKVGLDNGEGNWTKSDQRVSEEGETFDVWTNDDATVYIDTDIQVDI